MQPIRSIFASTTFKIFVLGVLTLLLLIPLALVKGIAHEREYMRENAQHEVARGWGSNQMVSPPFLVLTASVRRSREIEGKIETYVDTSTHTLLADQTTVDVDLLVSKRTINTIYSVPTYTARTKILGNFSPEDLRALGNIPGINWNSAQIGFAVSDIKGVAELRSFKLATIAIRPSALPNRYFLNQIALGSSLSTPSQPGRGAELLANAMQHNQAINFELEFDLRGVVQLQTLPLARSIQQTMRSTWPSPGYTDGVLPAEGSQPTAKGFVAKWSAAEFNRSFPQIAELSADANSLSDATFSVKLFEPGDIYERNNRALKYGILFLAMSIAGFFLVEILLGVRLHPMHYLQIGLALGMFYLLLIAFSEQLGFDKAYLIAAIAITLCVSGYVSAVLKGYKRGAVAAGVMASLYGFLYVLLIGENYSLTLGATGLFLILSVTMYLTRNINWFGNNDSTLPTSTDPNAAS